MNFPSNRFFGIRLKAWVFFWSIGSIGFLSHNIKWENRQKTILPLASCQRSIESLSSCYIKKKQSLEKFSLFFELRLSLQDDSTPRVLSALNQISLFLLHKKEAISWKIFSFLWIVDFVTRRFYPSPKNNPRIIFPLNSVGSIESLFIIKGRKERDSAPLAYAHVRLICSIHSQFLRYIRLRPKPRFESLFR